MNFRSYRQCDCLWHPRLNAIVGANGQGKTNVLDMVYYLSLCKSPGGLPDSASVHHGQEFFTLFGRYDHQGQEHTVGLRNPLTGAKSVQYDGKPCPRLSDHIGQIALVAIYPHDAELITDGGDLRRRFMNVAIAQYSPTYLTSLTALERALAQRNAYLKNDALQPTLLEALDAQIAPLGTAIHQARMQLCERLNPLFSEIYSQIGTPDERVSLGYVSQLNDADYPQLLRNSWDKDRALMHTTVGPHQWRAYPQRRVAGAAEMLYHCAAACAVCPATRTVRIPAHPAARRPIRQARWRPCRQPAPATRGGRLWADFPDRHQG